VVIAMTDTFEADVDRLRVALARTSRQLQRATADDGLTRTQLSVLGTVSRLGPIGIGELAEIEGLNPTMLSRVVAKLDDIGLISRQPDPADGRAARVVVTESGAAMHARLKQARSAVLSAVLRNLPEDQIAQLLAALPALEAMSDQLMAGIAARSRS
jgi:DNA-binding MarR family transcriptional regulator